MALLEAGTVLSRYTILGKLATGGMAEVYLARQSGPSGFQKLLVLKVILPHLAEDPEFLNMFHNEAKLAALLNHPNVVQIFDFGVDHFEGDEIQYMAMEYIDGLNLRRIMLELEDAEKRLSQPIAIRVISDACSALEYAHGLTGPAGNNLEVIHRDVSQENILLTYTGQVKLVDFGIAKARNLESYTSQGALRGKYRYMSPELIRGDQLDSRADIFSIGVVLYRLLLGQLPFEGDNHAQLIDRIVNLPPPRPTELREDLPEELERIILKALHKDRDQRYQRAAELQIDLEAHLLATGNAVMPYNLARFMEQTFPAGKDELRDRYQRLTGVSSKTPPEARKPDVPEVEEPGTGPLLRPPTPALADAGADNPELFKATVIGDDEPVAGAAIPEPPGARATLQDAIETRSTDPIQEQPTARRGSTPGQETAPALGEAKETLFGDPDELFAAEEDTPVDRVAPAHEPTPGAEMIITEQELEPVDDAAPAEAGGPLPGLPAEQGQPTRAAQQQRKSRAGLWIGLLVLLLGAGAGVYFLVLAPGSAKTPPVTPPPKPAVQQPPAAATDPDSGAPAQTPADQGAPAAADLPSSGPELPSPPPDQGAPDQAPPPPAPAPDSAPPAAPARQSEASLSVSCAMGGEVHLGKKSLGRVPLRGIKIPAGKHRVLVRSRKHGFTVTRNISVEAGAHQRLQITPRQGTIKIMVRPWAKVSLDGKVLGTTPLQPVKAYEGRHRLLLENSDLKVKKKKSVLVRAGKEAVVKVRLGQ